MSANGYPPPEPPDVASPLPALAAEESATAFVVVVLVAVTHRIAPIALGAVTLRAAAQVIGDVVVVAVAVTNARTTDPPVLERRMALRDARGARRDAPCVAFATIAVIRASMCRRPLATGDRVTLFEGCTRNASTVN
jgi:hypothetical protein